MNRVLMLALAVAFMCAGAALAGEVMEEADVVEAIPPYGEAVPDEPTGEEARRVLPTYETYDPDTGLADTVPSDAAGLMD